MSVKDFLSNLSDLELLSLRKYKYENYLPENRKLIDSEIRKRDLNINHIPDLVKKQSSLKESIVAVCPRCFSEKTDQIKGEDSYSYYMFIFRTRHKNHDYHFMCRICGYEFTVNR